MIGYKNKKLLHWEYHICRKSLTEIGNLYNTSARQICNWMEKFEISRRSLSEAFHIARGNHCNLSNKAIEWINGELLGDGNLNSQSQYSAYFRYTSKYKEYIDYIVHTLESSGIKSCSLKKKKYGNKFYNYYDSKAYSELLTIHQKWYPNGKKIIPKDLELTPITCKQWYIGDGSLKKYKGICLATFGFQVKDVEWLVEQLNELGFKTSRHRNNTIYISAKSSSLFLDYIGKCPVQCYQYKWKI